jgi:hypothetical protein
MADYEIEVSIPNTGPVGPQGPPGEFGELEAPEDGIIYGRKDGEWVDMTAPANLQVRRGTAAEVAAITPLEGEPVWATDTKKLRVGDGSTQGGISIGDFPISGTLAAAGAIYVSGAGLSQVNGVYEPLSVINGRQAYQKNQENYIIFYAGGAWYLSDFESDLYTAEADVTFPWEASPWTALEEEYGAAPTVSQGAIAGKVVANSLAQAAGVAGNSAATGSVDLQLERSDATQVASGRYAAIVAGRNNTASGSFATASGEGAVAHGVGMAALGFPAIRNFEQTAQSIEFGLRALTPDDTPTTMSCGLDFSGLPPFPLRNNTALFATVEIVAIEPSTATEAAHFIRKFAMKKVGGTASLIGNVTTIGTDYKSDEGYAVAITPGVTGGISVTGDETKTLRWAATVRGTELAIA